MRPRPLPPGVAVAAVPVGEPAPGAGEFVALCCGEGVLKVAPAGAADPWAPAAADVGPAARNRGREVRAWFRAYRRGEAPAAEDLPVAWDLLGATAFQAWVWRRLTAVPYGSTVTYGQLAREWEHGCGRPMAARAVGRAVGANPVAVAVPCHRVLAAGGRLGGYAWGAPVKAALLGHEGVVPGA